MLWLGLFAIALVAFLFYAWILGRMATRRDNEAPLPPGCIKDE